MGGRSGATTFPGRARNSGRGARVCQASGFVRPAQDVTKDVRQGWVAREFADVTPGFGTAHPQDRRRETPKSDPSPVSRPGIDPNPGALSAKDMGFTDTDVREALRRGISLEELRERRDVPFRGIPSDTQLQFAQWGAADAMWGANRTTWGTN